VENKGRIYIENKGNIYIEKEDEKNYTARPKDGEWFNVKRIFFEISGSYDFSPGSAILWLNKLGFPTGWDKKHLSVDGLEHTN
jgi:hypothetical protein